MHMCDLIKRLSKRKQIEAALRKEEEALLKMTNKYFRILSKTEATVQEELTKKQNNQRRLRTLEKTNKKLKLRLTQKENQNRENEKLQTEYENLTQKLENELMRKSIKKECTNVFLNTNALPATAQGLIACQHQWIPYNIPMDFLNMSEVPFEFWNHIQRHSCYREQWEQLILSSVSLN